MKFNILFLGAAILIAAIPFAVNAQFVSPSLDVSLGSLVGDDKNHDGQLPFWAELGDEVAQGVTIAVGHQSNADLNGDETDIEYFALNVQLCKGKLYCKASLKEPFRGDIKQVIRGGELGITRDRFRFTAFYEETPQNTYRIQGLKFGYTF